MGFKDLTPGEISSLMAHVDADGDNKIDLEEFIFVCGGEPAFAANRARYQQTSGAKRGAQIPGAVAMAGMARPSSPAPPPPGLPPPGELLLFFATPVCSFFFCATLALSHVRKFPLRGKPQRMLPGLDKSSPWVRRDLCLFQSPQVDLIRDAMTDVINRCATMRFLHLAVFRPNVIVNAPFLHRNRPK